MAAPATVEVRVDWRADGFNTISNDNFAIDVAGWSVGASINAAGTSRTRITGDGVAVVPGGVSARTCGELVTSGTNGSGMNNDFGTTTFSSGRTYRFGVWLKRVSGTTAGRILIGSLGTPADRAASTFTLTAAWVRYSVDWTPTANRTDVEVIVTNNAAATLTVRVGLAEVYETIDEITADVDELTVRRGANFEGSAEAPGTCSLRVRNDGQKYSRDNTGSVLSGNLSPGRAVWLRATESALVYGLFYGTLRRLVPSPRERMASLLAEDPLYRFGRLETSVVASLTRSLRDFRGAILDDIGEPTSRRSLVGGVEDDIVLSEADQETARSALAGVNTASGSIDFVRPHPSSSVLYQYTVVDRATLQSQAIDESFDAEADTVPLADLAGYDVTDELLVNSQRVFPRFRRKAVVAETVWESSEVPFSVSAETRSLWVGTKRRGSQVWITLPGQKTDLPTFTDPTFEQALVHTFTGTTPTVTFTPFSRSAK
ncbi:MAG: carbohydrate binding domain-containing protein, partial [Chloroflexi bacterium]|nr:carbohydrate binding domain-containing protein [Chloroflexota bacterium]